MFLTFCSQLFSPFPSLYLLSLSLSSLSRLSCLSLSLCLSLPPLVSTCLNIDSWLINMQVRTVQIVWTIVFCKSMQRFYCKNVCLFYPLVSDFFFIMDASWILYNREQNILIFVKNIPSLLTFDKWRSWLFLNNSFVSSLL